ncbi:MAG: alcohol dehydrogenase catalytic domain-containing protein [Pseudomonadota bacterium]
MKALVYTGPEALEIRDVPASVAAPGEVVVDVDGCGICGSDMHAFLGHDDRRPAPLTLGHEVAGRLPSGQRVTVNPRVSSPTSPATLAGRDHLCPERQILSMPPREGGFAGQVSIPADNVVAVPDNVSTEQAALAEPIACGWHAVRVAQPLVWADKPRALVIGGGAIGLGAVLSLVAAGVEDGVVAEPNPLRRKALERYSPYTPTAPEDVPDNAFDIVIDGVGYEATRAKACSAVTPGGVIIHIGLGSAAGGIDARRLTLQEIAFIGVYTYTAQDFRDCCAAMFSGRLGPLDWTETRPLDEGARAFADIRAGTVAAPKIILTP